MAPNSDTLSPAETDTLRRIAGMLLPPSEEYGVPGADDPLILADIIRSIGRDAANIRAALAELAPLRQDADIAVLRLRHRQRRHTRAPDPAMLLPRRPRAARPRSRTARALPQGPHRGTRRLVPPRPRPHPPLPSGATTGPPDMPHSNTANDIVDVLIIGSGASGAAVAWSLAETKMRILCLEQGDWMKPTEFPTNCRDWEARRFADFAISPNRRGRDDGLSDQRRQLADEDRQLQRRRRRHHPLHRALPAHAPIRLPRPLARRRGRRLADRLLDAGAVLYRERPHDGHVRPRRRSRRTPAHAAHAPRPARQNRRDLRPRDEQARLALVAVRRRRRHHRV